MKLLFNMTKKSGPKCKYLKIERTFNIKSEAFFIIFKEFSVARNCLRSKSETNKAPQFIIVISLLPSHQLNSHLFSCIINTSSYFYYHLIWFRSFYRDIKVFCFKKEKYA